MKKADNPDCICLEQANMLAESYGVHEGEIYECGQCHRRWYVGPIDKQTGYPSVRLRRQRVIFVKRGDKL
jgi:hypothetical protein